MVSLSCGWAQAYFGQKDAMQCVVITQMIEDLNQPVQAVICPTSTRGDRSMQIHMCAHWCI
jgi:pantothenate synthetase